MTAVRRFRESLGQVSWTARRYPPSRIRVQAEVVRRMDLPRLPSRRTAGPTWAVGVVRDEADVIEVTVRHLLGQDVEHVLLADNGSRDGTLELLQDLAAGDPRVLVAHDRHPAHHQAEKVTYLAHLAWRHGARWVVPVDADELHFAQGRTVGAFLATQDVGVVRARFHHMVLTEPGVPLTAGSEFVLDSTPSDPGKVVARSHPLLEIGPGNHTAARVGGVADGLFIAHAIYRSPEQLARKVRQGFDAIMAGTGRWAGTHWEKGARLDDDQVADAWRNLAAGRPEPRLDFAAAGPMVRVAPLAWRTWDPEGQVPGSGPA
ncbi:glycosyltransferase family 2 protein [Phycicoccus sp. CSK15P-2]|uniref:glycosyltransferase family 2 protein n=1 Tax=Phycicoccus sp. CSK15P-2 TaxID=2807627 RepID=UPI00195279F9|nr:glycosyltransferase family 2 protein [Phycicoccus sp. CSK15P-2]MBM6404305.1 glycosyltransferase family 2 protein [Phycicoccus sp. CSK15P-2]